MRSVGGDPRKFAVRRLLLGILLGVAALGFLIYQWRWISSAMHGPVPITLDELRQLEDPSTLRNPWVSLTYEQAIDTKLGLVSKKGGQSTPKSAYLLIKVGDRWLITEVPPSHSGREVVGYLDTWSTPLRKKAIDQIKANFPGQQAALLPYQFDAEYSYRGQCYAMVGVIGFFLLVGIVLAGMGLVGLLRNPRPDYGSGVA